MAKVWDVPWTFQETNERKIVTLDQEGYRTFVRMRDVAFSERDGLLIHGEALLSVVAEMDTWMAFYDTFPGAHLLSADERLRRFGEDEALPSSDGLKVLEDFAKTHDWEIPDRLRRQFSDEQTTLLDSTPPKQPMRLPYKDDAAPDMRDPEPPAWSTPSPLSAPESAASRLPEFDGETYWSALDHERLGKQLLRVGRQMADGQWHTLAELAAATGDPEASISARLRDLRKRKFGGHTVNRQRMTGGLWRYRLIRQQFETPWAEDET